MEPSNLRMPGAGPHPFDQHQSEISNRSIFNSMEDLRHLEQNPDTKSLGKLRDRKETMQFLERGKYVAVVADGKVHLYRHNN
jgi:hypothetical protein